MLPYQSFIQVATYGKKKPRREKTPEEILADDKKKKNKEVNSTTAYALVNSQLTEDGLKFKCIGQFYRAKIEVQLVKKKKAIFYVNYSRIYDDLAKIAPAVSALNNLIITFSKDVAIKNARDGEFLG